ncbi:MAG TPA: hypothetical protein VFO52_05260 [Longimicrobiales bacterium]|nr:hypothetical protein [Longimicrobiales bacterium]
MSSLQTEPIPTPADVDAIAALVDPVLRNLQITQCYSELARAFLARTGVAANWCSFATWASRQAGQSIRRQDLERALDHTLDAWFGSGAADGVAHAVRALGAEQDVARIRQVVRRALGVEDVVARSADAVARGNRKVFAEIGREFARFLEGCGRDAAADAARIDGFTATLRSGDPPDGQELLRQAFRHYYSAVFTSDPAIRAQYLLLANLEIGLHEQTRLQPEIAEAVDAAVLEAKDLAPLLLSELLPRRGIIARIRRFFIRLFGGHTPLDRAVDALLDEARRALRRVITDHMMSLELGTTRLMLGQDLRRPFSPALATLMEPELHALLARIDPTPDSTTQSGATDWAVIRERMHYIADLFRCYHDAPELFAPPFTSEQVSSIRAGRVPADL